MRWLRQSQTESYLPTFFWGLQNNPNSYLKSKARLAPCQATKGNPKIRKPAFHFADVIGEIIPEMPYLCEAEISGQKRTIFPIFPLF